MGQNQQNAEALGLCGPKTSPYLDAAGIKVMGKPVSVKARVLHAPYIEYDGGSVKPDLSKGTWAQRNKYLIPAKLGEQ